MAIWRCGTVIVRDVLHGSQTIKEEVLADLIKSRPVQRLKGATQSGFPTKGNADMFPTYTRFDHSVGVMLLLRRLGATLEEQVAGLLHDVSHTAFSHVIDWVMGDPSNESYQDSVLETYIRGSELSDILSEHGYSVARISGLEKNGNFGLLERKIPDLCADRIDYSLRDGHLMYKLDSDYCIRHLKVRDGEIVFDSRRAASLFGRNYMRCQREYWGGNEARLRYYFISQALKIGIRRNVISKPDFYRSERYIISKLRGSGVEEITDSIAKGLGVLHFTLSKRQGIKLLKKLRYVDPKYVEDGKERRLSEVDAAYRRLIAEEKARCHQSVKVDPYRVWTR
jgi:hypothetical protein